MSCQELSVVIKEESVFDIEKLKHAVYKSNEYMVFKAKRLVEFNLRELFLVNLPELRFFI